ncbi:YheC/YheD family protein [Natranaerofaba carboxydovora]|uniref:YheC/YheD family endospore coat-associated protein n=1 Tax=Natranaerofaba carboxydovora TaxID=2742683 RepID=UPI001F139B84|nr:YheC/YheD family protein [Natranaerofaba carboxydovora]UMZ72746.1 Endospore coat-associated protein YheD [Natranaerofaba carboxydovora]
MQKDFSPLVGVCINSSKVKKLNQSLERGSINYLLEANKKLNTNLYFFSLVDINFEEDKVRGYIYDETCKKWEERFSPLPEVLYKKGGVKKKEIGEFNSLINSINKNNIKLINPMRGFNKWELHKHFQKNKKISPHLEKTVLFLNPEDLQEMIYEEDSIYLKAVRGRCGKNLMKIKKLDKGFLSTFFRKQPKKIPAKSFEELLDDIDRFFGGSPIIVQRTIDLLNIDNKLVDLRAEVHRNYNNELEIVGIPVRIGEAESPITQHSKSYTFDNFFRNTIGLSDTQINELYMVVENLLYEVYKSVEDYYGNCGEIGIDIGVDKNLQVKLIECNSQPTKISLKDAYGEEAVKKGYEKILEYACFLASPKTI